MTFFLGAVIGAHRPHRGAVSSSGSMKPTLALFSFLRKPIFGPRDWFCSSSSVLGPFPVPHLTLLLCPSLPQLPLFFTVSFLRSGTKLIFRRRPRQKEAGLSQSHDDLSNTTATPSVRKKAGSFSRRLIKRFSFKSKPKANGSPSPQL